MAIYKLNSKKKGGKNVKKIVGFTLIGVSSVAYLFLTGIWSPIFNFLLGTFGVFAYALFLILFIVGLALVNNRRYVMSMRYLLSMCFMVFFALCIIQLIIVGNSGDLSFGQYLALNYTQKWTAGGIICGLVTTSLLYLAKLAGAYIILVLAFLLCLALFLDSLNVFRRVEKKSKNLELKSEKKVVNPLSSKRENKVLTEPQPLKEKEEVNVVLNGNLEEEKKEEKRALTAREILGLDKKRNVAYEFAQKEEVKKEQKLPPKSLRELILTPPEINYEEYFKEMSKNEPPKKEEVNKNVEVLKQEKMDLETTPTFQVQTNFDGYSSQIKIDDDEFKNVNNPFVRDTSDENTENEVEDVSYIDNFDQDEQDDDDNDIISQADDIIRSAVMEEKAENPEEYENAVEPTGDFNRRDSFDRRNDNFTRRDNNFAPEFPDRSASRPFPTRQQETPEPEEEEEDNEPYIYEKPSLDFITTKSVDLSTLSDDVAEKRVLLENTLENFGIPAKVRSVVVGPAVTRYELEMPAGVPVTKIKNRSDDIALSLATEGSVRIEAPVPGRSVVGVEVPNKTIATVSLRDILESREFRESPSPLTFALGKDIAGSVIVANMQKLTHLLVAGSTGSGKSVCLNSIILSIIYKSSPEDVRIVLVDPKRVEFTSYNGLPHLIMPNVICDTQKAINTLNWAITEMEHRFELLGLARVKNIDEYNATEDVKSGKVKKMPFIVIIVDELADLMMTGKKEVEEKIIRLAQKSRAAGIHLILATQRPSADVITGLIKSNIPSRIAFAVTSGIDSSIILDRVGAEKLLGKGDMLYYPIGSQDPKRVQGCFITTNETNNIVDFVRENNKPIFDKKVEEQIDNPNKNAGVNGIKVNNELDELFPLALKTVIECGQASTTMLRRRFAIGFPRASRIIDQMEELGYISQSDGPKGRQVYVTMDEFREIYGDQYD